jgi:hypothetical protein
MLDMVRLLKGECRATSEEMKKFQEGDTIWGNDENPEELKRWTIEEKEEAEPFEASDELESDLDAEAWTELYNQYIGE